MLRLLLLELICLLAAPPFRLPNAPMETPRPMPAPAAGPVKIAPDVYYVIDSDVPLLVLSSPKEAVTVVAEEGPIRLRGKFADGNGGIETRTYKGKHVYSVEATGHAKACELLVIPVGTAAETGVARVQLVITDPQCPQPPPPGSKPDPKPEDPKPIAGKVYFLIVRPSGAATQEFERNMLLPAWAELRSAGHLVKDKAFDQLGGIYSPPSGTTLPFVVTLRINEGNTESKVIAGPVPLPATNDGIRELAKGIK